jgi:hypothetical protein
MNNGRLVLAAGIVGISMLATGTFAQTDGLALADSLRIVGVKKMKIIETNGVYIAYIDVEFMNQDPEKRSVKLVEPSIDVYFETESGKKVERTKTSEVLVAQGEETAQIARRSELPIKGDPYRLGSNERSDDILFKPSVDGKVVKPFIQTIQLIVGPSELPDTRERIVRIVNLIGDPSGCDFVMKLKIKSRVGLGFSKGRGIIVQPTPYNIELMLVPQVREEYLFQ